MGMLYPTWGPIDLARQIKSSTQGGKVICPGFVNLHVHSQLNVGDYLLTDVTKKDYLGTNYFVFGAPVKGKTSPPPPPVVAVGREYPLFSALRNGATTILDPGGAPGDWGAM